MAPRRPSTARTRPKASKRQIRKQVKKKRKQLVHAKRSLRGQLVADARRRWRQAGHAERHAYLQRVRRALVSEGYRPTPFQWRHKGHAYGLVKDRGDKQIHVRVYEDGIIDAELEIHRGFLEHLLSPRPSAHHEVKRVLARHGIDASLVNEHYIPKVGASRRRFPRTRTPVRRVLKSSAGMAALLVGVSVARMLLKRKRRAG